MLQSLTNQSAKWGRRTVFIESLLSGEGVYRELGQKMFCHWTIPLFREIRLTWSYEEHKSERTRVLGDSEQWKKEIAEYGGKICQRDL